MDDQDLVHNQVPKRKGIKDFSKELERQIRILCLDFSLESVHLVHGNRFMVSAGHIEGVWIEEFKGEENQYALDRKGTTVHKVSIKEVHVGWRREPVLGKDVQEIIVLPVNVAADCETRALRNHHVYERRLGDKVLFCLFE